MFISTILMCGPIFRMHHAIFGESRKGEGVVFVLGTVSVVQIIGYLKGKTV